MLQAAVIKDVEQRIESMFDLVEVMKLEEIDGDNFELSVEGVLINGDGLNRYTFLVT